MTSALLVLALALPVLAARTDDSDLSGPPSGAAAALKAESIEAGRRFKLQAPAPQVSAAGALSVTGRFTLSDAQGQAVPGRGAVAVLLDGSRETARAQVGEDGSWSLTAPKAGKYKAVLRLETARWSIVDEASGKPFEWEAGEADLTRGGSVALGETKPDPASANGKIPLIHLQLEEAVAFFGRQGLSLDWWSKKLAVNYPASSDYFSSWDYAVHLSHAEAWDVNLHEIGHSVMDAAMSARGGGGSHKIDECYSQGLALSEGWATFFAGAVRLSPGDADAKFQYLVPRRAPIRIENVPDDVCKGENNEWRVAAALWDLHDSHPDGGDDVVLGFPRLWNALRGGSMGSLSDAWRLVRRTLSDPEAAAAAKAMEHNTVPGPLTPALDPPKFD